MFNFISSSGAVIDISKEQGKSLLQVCEEINGMLHLGIVYESPKAPAMMRESREDVNERSKKKLKTEPVVGVRGSVPISSSADVALFNEIKRLFDTAPRHVQDTIRNAINRESPVV